MLVNNFFQKGLDIAGRVCYNSKASEAGCPSAGTPEWWNWQTPGT